MDRLPGAWLFFLMLGVVLAAAAGWCVALLYRRRLLALMRGGPAPDERAPPRAFTLTLAPRHTPPPLDPAGNRRARFRLLGVLAGLSLLVGLTQSALALHFVYEADRALSPKQWLVVGLILAWPMLLGWGLLLRWAWWRVVAGVAVYFVLITPVVLLASSKAQTLQVVFTLYGLYAAIPLAIVLLIGASGQVRAAAPYLLPVFLGLLSASHVGLEALTRATSGAIATWPQGLKGLIATLGAQPTIALFALAPWLLAAWPVYRLGRGLAAAYRRKRYSDLIYLFAAYWLLVLFTGALMGLAGTGWPALWQVLAWAWLPLGFFLLRRWLAPAVPAPTLLVLRVFGRDAAVAALFDRVVERWRLTGNTLLIAGTDLASRTLDPDDLFVFLNGRLAERFVTSAEAIPRHVAALDLAPDPDGRFRVNELHCFDTTWQSTLRALVELSDVVLMDLRGFQAENAGCRLELRVLAGSLHLQRVVLLRDAQTDRAAAQAEIAAVPAGRFVWLDAGRLDGGVARRVLQALFAAERPATNPV